MGQAAKVPGAEGLDCRNIGIFVARKYRPELAEDAVAEFVDEPRSHQGNLGGLGQLIQNLNQLQPLLIRHD